MKAKDGESPKSSQNSHRQNINIPTIQIGDIIYVILDQDDGLKLNKGYKTRRKYIVIIGFTDEGIAIGALLINSKIDPSKYSQELLNCQYPLLARNYRNILEYDSWLDCSDIFELSQQKLSERILDLKGKLIEEDRERIFQFLKDTDIIDNITKKRFGLI